MIKIKRLLRVKHRLLTQHTHRPLHKHRQRPSTLPLMPIPIPPRSSRPETRHQKQPPRNHALMHAMSIYCSFGVFANEGGQHPAPLIYQQSHVLPTATDPRGGSLGLAAIPASITRDAHTSAPDDNATWWPYLRVSLHATTGDDTVVLDAAQAQALRDELTTWLNHTNPHLE